MIELCDLPSYIYYVASGGDEMSFPTDTFLNKEDLMWVYFWLIKAC